MILGAFGRVAPVRDAVTHKVPVGMELAVPPLYMLLSPLSRLLDSLGLLSTGQHIAVVLTMLGIAGALGAMRADRDRRVKGASIWTGATLGTLAILYAMTAALPRPMAKLVAANSNLVRVDLHSHTNASHDARSSFDAGDNREWHRAGGVDVAYVTDHSTFKGAEAGERSNAARAGDGTVLLTGFEGRYRGTFMLFLSMTQGDSASLIDSRRHLRSGTLLAGRTPTAIMAIPGPLIDLPLAATEIPPGIAAVEVVDGSPRGLAQHDRDRREIARLADSLRISAVAGSNNHGWGRAIPAWTVIWIPGWRTFSSDSLAASIERGLYRSSGVPLQVVERTRPHFTGVALALTAPAMAGQIVGTLRVWERFVWLAWIWGIAYAWHRVRPHSRRIVRRFRRRRGRATYTDDENN